MYTGAEFINYLKANSQEDYAKISLKPISMSEITAIYNRHSSKFELWLKVPARIREEYSGRVPDTVLNEASYTTNMTVDESRKIEQKGGYLSPNDKNGDNGSNNDAPHNDAPSNGAPSSLAWNNNNFKGDGSNNSAPDICFNYIANNIVKINDKKVRSDIMNDIRNSAFSAEYTEDVKRISNKGYDNKYSNQIAMASATIKAIDEAFKEGKITEEEHKKIRRNAEENRRDGVLGDWLENRPENLLLNRIKRTKDDEDTEAVVLLVSLASKVKKMGREEDLVKYLQSPQSGYQNWTQEQKDLFSEITKTLDINIPENIESKNEEIEQFSSEAKEKLLALKEHYKQIKEAEKCGLLEPEKAQKMKDLLSEKATKVIVQDWNERSPELLFVYTFEGKVPTIKFDDDPPSPPPPPSPAVATSDNEDADDGGSGSGGPHDSVDKDGILGLEAKDVKLNNMPENANNNGNNDLSIDNIEHRNDEDNANTGEATEQTSDNAENKNNSENIETAHNIANQESVVVNADTANENITITDNNDKKQNPDNSFSFSAPDNALSLDIDENVQDTSQGSEPKQDVHTTDEPKKDAASSSYDFSGIDFSLDAESIIQQLNASITENLAEAGIVLDVGESQTRNFADKLSQLSELDQIMGRISSMGRQAQLDEAITANQSRFEKMSLGGKVLYSTLCEKHGMEASYGGADLGDALCSHFARTKQRLSAHRHLGVQTDTQKQQTQVPTHQPSRAPIITKEYGHD